MTEQTVEEFLTELIHAVPRLARPVDEVAQRSSSEEPRASETQPPN
jgi:hypothetical protein